MRPIDRALTQMAMAASILGLSMIFSKHVKLAAVAFWLRTTRDRSKM
jgi:hypothetical protein